MVDSLAQEVEKEKMKVRIVIKVAYYLIGSYTVLSMKACSHSNELT